jgi:hypothetical protein
MNLDVTANYVARVDLGANWLQIIILETNGPLRLVHTKALASSLGSRWLCVPSKCGCLRAREV